MKNVFKSLITGTAVVFFLTECTHKELCYDHSHGAVSVNVVFDWKNAPDADPASMSLYLFPKEGGKPERYELTEREGGTIRVEPGIYDVICVNSDTEGVTTRNTDKFGTFELSTNTSEPLTYSVTSLGVPADNVPRAEGTESERVALPADTLWSDAVTDITVASSGKETVITLEPATSVSTYRIEITNAENIEYVMGLSASLSGMAGGVIPASGAVSSERVTHPFEMKKTEDKTGINGSLLTFGHCPDAQGQHALIVYAILTDGSKFAYKYDAAEVTRQIHEAPDPRNVLVRLDGLKLPKPIPGEGGFKPEIGDWQEEEVEIEM